MFVTRGLSSEGHGKKIHRVVVGGGGVYFLISTFLCFTNL